MRRLITISLGMAIGLAMMVAVLVRQNRIVSLKVERAQVLARLAIPIEAAPPVVPATPTDFKSDSHSPSIELLQLRAEVTRLGNRKRELANVRGENERLQKQPATRGTNAPGVVELPAGYIRKSQARNLGYDTPEATMETFLWATQNRDPTGYLQALDPAIAEQFRTRIQDPSSREAFFKTSDAMPGFHILGKADGTEGEVVLTVEFVPTQDSQQLRFKQFDGQWKLVGGF